jgi:transcriptional regulator with XRE-family HTH domain
LTSKAPNAIIDKTNYVNIVICVHKVKDVETFTTWRALLGSVIQDAFERQRIASELGVNMVTLTRWVHGTSTPRAQHLRRLLSALPHYRDQLIELISREDESVLVGAGSAAFEEEDEIPSEFYARVFNAYAMTPRAQRSWSVTNLILQQALAQLDPHQVGMAITVVQCMSPSMDGKVNSLRERTGYGTSPWSMNLEPYAVFLGAESLAGYVASSCYPRVLQNSNEHQGIIPAHWVEWERSAAVYPIARGGKVAGCLLVSCSEPNYFSATRQKLIEQYANLLVLVFELSEFYELSQINLRVMPNYQRQAQYLSSFRQRVAECMTIELRKGHPLDLKQAEMLIWQELEQELSHLPLNIVIETGLNGHNGVGNGSMHVNETNG